MPKMIIVGGGIGGLATAIVAGRRGFDVVVLEQKPAYSEVGAGIQLAPNAFHALDLLGVGEEVRERSVEIEALRLMDGRTGAPIARMALLDEYRHRFGNIYAVAHRQELHEVLVRACRSEESVTLLDHHKVDGYTQDGAGVTVVSGTGDRWRGDVLVGADGIRSVIREQMLGDGPPRVSGHTIYRCLVPMSLVPADLRSHSVTLWAGPGWHAVHYPVAGGTHLNLAATRDDGATEIRTGTPVDDAVVAEMFEGAADVPRRTFALGTGWRTWVLCDRAPVQRWTDGRVALLGDAAHPMLQYAAQGAGMALEDAVVLGTLLDPCDPDPASTLRHYVRVRRDRTARTQEVSRSIGDVVYHATGPQARRRDAMFASWTDEDLRDQVSWLHSTDVLDPVLGPVSSAES